MYLPRRATCMLELEVRSGGSFGTCGLTQSRSIDWRGKRTRGCIAPPTKARRMLWSCIHTNMDFV